MNKVVFVLIYIIMSSYVIDGTSDNVLLKYESLYSSGITAYLENNWAGCVRYLELAIDDWLWWNKNIMSCRRGCYDEANRADLIFKDSEFYEYEKVFEKMVKNTLCLVKCKKNIFGSRVSDATPGEVIEDFKKKKPYDYLQLCYYKQGQLDKAANAAATILAKQPDHEIMQENIKYYVTKGGLDVKDIINLEMGDHTLKFMEGDQEYQEERYKESIELMEESLNLFWKALVECRMGCEDPFDQGWYPDFVSSVANHYTFTLRCKLKCPQQLSTFYGEDPDFVSSVMNYLQFSYFKVNELQKSCEAVESYLLIYSNDSMQVNNKEFLSTQKGIQQKFFTPRKSVLKYMERQNMEAELMKFIEESFALFFESKEYDETPLPSALESDISKNQNAVPTITDTLLEIADMLGARSSSEDLSHKEEL